MWGRVRGAEEGEGDIWSRGVGGLADGWLGKLC